MSEIHSNTIKSYIQQKDEFDYLISLIDSLEKGKSIGILLYGPPGTGKTLLAISLARKFNALYYLIDGSPELDRRDLEGNWELIAGNTRFNYGPLTRAIADANEKGISFVIINEINAIRESEQISLNSILSENHITLISKGFEKYELNGDSKLVIIGTMNKGVVGINKLQEAFDDRFIVCPEVNYPIESKEIDIASNVSGCSKKIAEIVVDVAREIRKQAIEDFSITKIFSTRLIVNFCTLISKMPSKYLRHNIENMIINKLGETTEEKKSIAMILDGKMFESKLQKQLIGNDEKFEVDNIQAEKEADEALINEMKIKINNYINKFGQRNLLRKNGTILWKALQWMWDHERKILQEYFNFFERIHLPALYKRKTGNKHLYRGKISLAYIKWIFRQKNNELIIYMKQLYPVL